jgi:hypothetical protein
MLNNMSHYSKRTLNLQLIIYVVNPECSVKGKWLASEIEMKEIQAF